MSRSPLASAPAHIARPDLEVCVSADLPPWHAEADVLPTMFAGVSAPARVDRALAVEVLRGAVELATGWIGLDVTWSTYMSVNQDDVRTHTNKLTRPGVDWDFVSTKPGTPESIHLTGVCTELERFPTHPNHTVAEVSGRFPVFAEGLGRDVGRMSVTV